MSRTVAALLAVASMAAPADAQLQLATVTAVVIDARQGPVAGAEVALTAPLGAELRRAMTDASGRAIFHGLAPGRYQLTTRTTTPPVIQLPLTVAAALPIEITVRVPAAVTDRVVVEGVDDQTTARGSIAGDSIAPVPTRTRSRALQDVLTTLPGWSAEDNGLLHSRGVDDGFLYVIDGVPVYERLDAFVRHGTRHRRHRVDQRDHRLRCSRVRLQGWRGD